MYIYLTKAQRVCITALHVYFRSFIVFVSSIVLEFTFVQFTFYIYVILYNIITWIESEIMNEMLMKLK